MLCLLHNIIQIHNIVLRDHNILQNIPHTQAAYECGEYYAKYCQSHKTMLWI